MTVDGHALTEEHACDGEQQKDFVLEGHQARNEQDPVALLAGKRVLIVEDSPLIAASSDEMVRGFGCSVIGPAQNMADALEMAQTATIDVATVDLNIRGGKAFPLLRVLRQRNIPFLITSGYANWSMPDEWENDPRLAKPYSEAALRDALQKLA